MLVHARRSVMVINNNNAYIVNSNFSLLGVLRVDGPVQSNQCRYSCAGRLFPDGGQIQLNIADLLRCVVMDGINISWPLMFLIVFGLSVFTCTCVYLLIWYSRLLVCLVYWSAFVGVLCSVFVEVGVVFLLFVFVIVVRRPFILFWPAYIFGLPLLVVLTFFSLPWLCIFFHN